MWMLQNHLPMKTMHDMDNNPHLDENRFLDNKDRSFLLFLALQQINPKVRNLEKNTGPDTWRRQDRLKTFQKMR